MLQGLRRRQKRNRLLVEADYRSGNARHHLHVAGVYAHQALMAEQEGRDSGAARAMWALHVADAQAAFDQADALREEADRA